MCRRDAPARTGEVLYIVRSQALIVAWFAAAWAARGLPPLGDVDRRTLRRRAGRMSRDELELAIDAAERFRDARCGPFVAVFARPETLHELVHEARGRRDAAPVLASAPRVPRALVFARAPTSAPRRRNPCLDTTPRLKQPSPAADSDASPVARATMLADLAKLGLLGDGS